MVRTYVSDPDSFVRQRVSDASLRWPVAIVLGVGVVRAVQSLVVLLGTVKGTTSGIEAFLTVGGTVSTISSVFGVLGMWLLYAVLFYLLSLYFDADGSFRTLFVLVGWGFVPLLLSGVFAIAMTGVTLALTGGVQNPESLSATIEALETVRNAPPLQTAQLVRIVCLFWSGLIWTFVVKHARSLELRQAFLTVVLPVAAMAVWQVVALVG